MLSNVATRNVATGANEISFHITIGVQISNAYVSEELGSDKNKRKDNVYAWIVNEIFVPPPLVHNGRPSYIWREKRYARSSTTRSITSKRSTTTKCGCSSLVPVH